MTARSFLVPANPDAERRRRERWRKGRFETRRFALGRWYQIEVEYRGDQRYWKVINRG